MTGYSFSRLIMRFRPRFSIRTLAIFVTVVCAYFGTWEATKRAVKSQLSHEYYSMDGTRKLSEHELQSGSKMSLSFWSRSPAPLVISRDVLTGGTAPRRYYLWLFGPEFKLPIESTWDPNERFSTQLPFGSPSRFKSTLD